MSRISTKSPNRQSIGFDWERIPGAGPERTFVRPLTTRDAEERRLLEKHREQKRQEEERRRLFGAEADALRERLLSTDWLTRDGEVIPVSKMTPRHAQNAVRFAEGIAFKYRTASARAGQDWRVGFVDSWPLLDALRRRAAQEPTLRDRWVDKRNGRQYRKRSKS